MPAARDGDLEFQCCRLLEEIIVTSSIPLAHSILLQLNRSPYLTNMPQPRFFGSSLARVEPEDLTFSPVCI